MTETHKISEVLVTGKLPFCLLLDDTIEEGNLNPKNAIFIKSNDGKIVAYAFFKKMLQPNPGITIATEDFFGELSYSRFALVFYHTKCEKGLLDYHLQLSDDGINYDLEPIIEIAHELINKLVQIYVNVHQSREKDWIPLATKKRMSPWGVHILNMKNERIGGIQSMDYRGTGRGLGNRLKPEQLKELKDVCLWTSYRVEPSVKFMQEANRYRFTGDFLTAVIFYATYIEKMIFREIKYKLEAEGKNEDQIGAFIMNSQRTKYVHRYRAIEQIAGNASFKEHDAFRDYETYIVAPRNEIGHRDTASFGQKDSNNMVQAGNRFVPYIVNIIWGRSNQTLAVRPTYQ